MTGPQHYANAEACRVKAAEAQTAAYDNTTTDGWEKAAYWNAAAQVEATLALAAATAYPAVKDYLGDESTVAREWTAVT